MKLCLLAGLAAMALAGPANAALMTYTFDLPSPQGPITHRYFSSTEIPDFNPEIGKLLSFDIHLAGTVGPADAAAFYIETIFGSPSYQYMPTATNGVYHAVPGSFSYHIIEKAALDLAVVTGTGTFMIGDIIVTNAAFVTFAPGSTLTYLYTPSTSAVPEPADLAILGVGALALGLIVRQRSA